MRSKLSQEMKEWPVEGLEMDDIMETVRGSQQIVKGLPTKKYNESLFRQFWSIASYHMPKAMVLQGLLSVTLILLGCTSLYSMEAQSDSFNRMLFSMVTFFGIISMVTISSEFMRSRLMGSWEIEKVCRITPQKVFLFKMLILSTLSTILIFVFSTVLSSLFQVSLLKIFFYGYVPFLVLTACILQFSAYINTTEALLGVYLCGFILIYALALSTMQEMFYTTFYVGIMIVALGFFFYSIYRYSTTQCTKIGGTLC